MFILTFLLLTLNISFGQLKKETLIEHSLKDKTIRSYAVNPLNKNIFLVGIKGNPGEGKVLLSNNSGIEWTPLNNNLALCDSCEDVQAVCFVDSLTLLAGTWKNGMFRSIDAGRTFVKLSEFPAKDVRSIKRSKAGLIYASTTTHGVLISRDKGRSWKNTNANELNKTLSSWSLEIAPGANNILYALTFGNGIQKSIDAGANWNQVLVHQNVMIWDIDFFKNEIFAVGSNDSSSYLYHSYMGSNVWDTKKLNVSAANTIKIIETPIGFDLLVGTWGNGLYKTKAIEYSIEGYYCALIGQNNSVTVTKIYTDAENIYNFSWGDGLQTFSRETECGFNIPKTMTINCDNKPCFEISSPCESDYFYFKLYNKWGDLIYKNSKNVQEVNDFMNKPSNFKEGENAHLYWLKTSFEESSDTISFKGEINVLR